MSDEVSVCEKCMTYSKRAEDYFLALCGLVNEFQEAGLSLSWASSFPNGNLFFH